jgi:hypothetical protein
MQVRAEHEVDVFEAQAFGGKTVEQVSIRMVCLGVRTT